MKIKFKLLAGFSFFISASMAFASGGGMIGGGDDQFKIVLSCTAQSMDPTFVSEVTSVALAKEVDTDGNILPSSNLTLLMIDKDQKVLRYYPTQQKELFVNPNNVATVDVWKYAEGTENNLYLATFLVQFETQTGHIVSFADLYEIDELELSQCK